MTKKEQAEMESLRQDLVEAKALRWPLQKEPSPIDIEEAFKGKSFDHLEVGWYSHQHDGRFNATEGCSSTCFHSRISTTKTDSQRAGVMYRTKLEALLAARWSMTREYAKALARIDKAIAEEELK